MPVVWSSASAQIRSRQDPEGEEELERAFQVSPKAIFAAPCQVEFDRMSAGPPRLETQQCGRLGESPGLGMFPSAACPDSCPSHEAIKQTNPVSLRDIDARHIYIYLRSKEARSPRLPVLLAPSPAACDIGRLKSGNASTTNRKCCVGTPPGPTLGSVISHLTST